MSDDDKPYEDLIAHIAEHGLPRPEDCTPWEEIRDRRLKQLGEEQYPPGMKLLDVYADPDLTPAQARRIVALLGLARKEFSR